MAEPVVLVAGVLAAVVLAAGVAVGVYLAIRGGPAPAGAVPRPGLLARGLRR
jgi:hypothetical protein